MQQPAERPVALGVLLGTLSERVLSAAKDGRYEEVLTTAEEMRRLADRMVEMGGRKGRDGELTRRAVMAAAAALAESEIYVDGILRKARLGDRNRPAYRRAKIL